MFAPLYDTFPFLFQAIFLGSVLEVHVKECGRGLRMTIFSIMCCCLIWWPEHLGPCFLSVIHTNMSEEHIMDLSMSVCLVSWEADNPMTWGHYWSTLLHWPLVVLFHLLFPWLPCCCQCWLHGIKNMLEVLVYYKVYIVPVFLNIAQIESFQSRFKVLRLAEG
jgi:hypothetical protein